MCTTNIATFSDDSCVTYSKTPVSPQPPQVPAPVQQETDQLHFLPLNANNTTLTWVQDSLNLCMMCRLGLLPYQTQHTRKGLMSQAAT